MLLTATLALLSCPSCTFQDPRLQLPPVQTRPGSRVQAAPEPQAEIDRFRRDLLDLHTPSKADGTLMDLGQRYRSIDSLILAVCRKAGPRELQDLVVVAGRYGTPRVGDEFLFQLLARPLGTATRPVLEAMVALKRADEQGDHHKEALMECIRGRISAVRFHATELLAAELQAGATDAELKFALLLSSEPGLDLQLSGVQLLAAIAQPAARQRLLELLSKEPTVAGAACAALVRIGTDAAPVLQQALSAPVIDRAFGYAAFALAMIGDQDGQLLLPPELQPKLRAQLQQPDQLMRSLCAVPLADLGYYATAAVPGGDEELVDALLLTVEPLGFVANLDMLRTPAEQRLQRASGRYGSERGWRAWWADARNGFVAMRAEVPIDAANSGRALVTVRVGGGRVRLLGEQLAGVTPLGDSQELLLSAEQMLELVQQLRQAGLREAGQQKYAAGLPLTRSIELQVDNVRTVVAAPAQDARQFDELAARVEAVVQREVWQLYRDPLAEPDRGAFWLAERKWMAANPDPIAQERHFLLRAVHRWSQLPENLKGRALERAYRVADRARLVQEEDGAAMVAMLRTQASLGEHELRLLELAASAPGDAVWRDVIDVASTLPGAGPKAVSRVFALLGPDRVLAALQDQRGVVRRAAIDEVVQLEDMRAGPRLVQLLDDVDESVSRSAVFACGALGIAAARPRLMAMVAAESTLPQLRREALRSVGRIGGPGAFELLERALAAPQREDRQAALRGLGELREARSAQLLAEMFVAGTESETGELARFYLQRLGASLAVPALRSQLGVQDPQARRELVDLLAAYQDPNVIPDLIDQLRQNSEPLRAVANLECITGLDVTSREERVGALEKWFADHKLEPQWQWLLQALARDNIKTTLQKEQFDTAADLAAVPELTRLLLELREGRLRSLTAAVLRNLTGEDYGMVTPLTPHNSIETMAARYRALFEGARAAQKR